MAQVVNVNFRMDAELKKVWNRHVLSWECQ